MGKTLAPARGVQPNEPTPSSLQVKRRKHHSLMGQVRDPRRLRAAYEAVRTVPLRELYDKQRNLATTAVPIVTPYAAPTPRPEDGAGSNVIDFGRYTGYSLEQLRRIDPEYLKWLSRHSSGIRYRRRIQELLASPTRLLLARAHAAASRPPSSCHRTVAPKWQRDRCRRDSAR